MPKDLNQTRLNVGGSFYCPNGHGQSYTTPRVTALQRKLEETMRALFDAKLKTTEAEQKIRDAESVTVRLKKRIANGVCPCCHRTFSNLARHMKTKHKDM
jgi:hypothetical protein